MRATSKFWSFIRAAQVAASGTMYSLLTPCSPATHSATPRNGIESSVKLMPLARMAVISLLRESIHIE